MILVTNITNFVIPVSSSWGKVTLFPPRVEMAVPYDWMSAILPFVSAGMLIFRQVERQTLPQLIDDLSIKYAAATPPKIQESATEKLTAFGRRRLGC